MKIKKMRFHKLFFFIVLTCFLSSFLPSFFNTHVYAQNIEIISARIVEKKDNPSELILELTLDKPIMLWDQKKEREKWAEKKYPEFRIVPSLYTWHSGIIANAKGNEIHSYSGSFEAGRRYRLIVEKQDIQRSTIDKKEFVLVAPDLKPELKFSTTNGLIELKGPQRLPIECTNIDDIFCQINDLPPGPTLAAIIARARELENNHKSSQCGQEAIGRQGLLEIQETISNETIKLKNIPYLFPTPEFGEIGKYIPLNREFSQWHQNFARELKTERIGFLTNGEKNVKNSITIPLYSRKEPENGGFFLIEAGSIGIPSNKPLASLFAQITDMAISFKIGPGEGINPESHKDFSDYSEPKKGIKPENIGVFDKKSSLAIWLTSLSDGRSLKNVPILIGTRDGFVFFAGLSDDNGILLLKAGQSLPALHIGDYKSLEAESIKSQKAKSARSRFMPFDPNKARFIMACPEKNEGFALADMSDKKSFIAWNHGISTEKKENKASDSLVGQIICERGIWKIGDKIYFKAFIRQMAKLAPLRLYQGHGKVKFIAPNGDMILEKSYEINEFGTISDIIVIPNWAKPGRYNLELFVENQRISEKSCLITDFIAPRHQVAIDCEIAEELAYFTISSNYLAGGPVSNAKVHWKASLLPAKRVPQPGYFSGSKDEEPIEIESGEGILDAQGKMSLILPLDSRILSGAFDMGIEAFCGDLDGRYAFEKNSVGKNPDIILAVPEHTESILANEPFELELKIVDKAGKNIEEGLIRCEVLTRSWLWTMQRDSKGKMMEKGHEIWRKNGAINIEIKDGHAKYQAIFPAGGHYKLAFIYQKGTEIYSSETMLWVDGPGYYQEESYRGGLTVKVKDRAKKSEIVKGRIFATAPISQCLISLEDHDIHHITTIKMESSSEGGAFGDFEFQLLPSMKNNLYITAMAPLPRKNYPIYRSDKDLTGPGILSGAAMIRVEEKPKKLNISVTGSGENKVSTSSIDDDNAHIFGEGSANGDSTPSIDDKNGPIIVRPGEKVELAVKISGEKGENIPSELMVSVVEEGVLRLTKYNLPDLHKALSFLTPLRVISGDLRGSLILQMLDAMATILPFTGGDGADEGMEQSISPRSNFAPVAFFEGQIRTDSDGLARISFEMPHQLTSWRINIVACDNQDGFGNYSGKIITTQPFSLELAMPRFLLCNDKATMNISGINRNDFPLSGQLNAQFPGHENFSKYFDIPSNARTVVELDIQAPTYPGTGEIFIQALAHSEKGESIQEKFSDAIAERFTVLPAFTMGIHCVFGFERGVFDIELPEIPQLDGQDKKSLLEIWKKTDKPRAILAISQSPAAILGPPVLWLKNYPYNCLEQISSQIIAFSALLAKKALPPSGISEENARNFILSKLEILESMATQSGGFGFWPGALYPAKEASVYALWALLSADSIDIPVNKPLIDNCANYLKEKVINSGTDDINAMGEFILALGDKSFEYKPFSREELGDKSKEAAIFSLMAQATLRANQLNKLGKSGDFDKSGDFIKAKGYAKDLGGIYKTLALDSKTRQEIKGNLDHIFQRPSQLSQGFYSSENRERAALLLAYSIIDPQSPNKEKLIKDIIQSSAWGFWKNTSDTGINILALCQFANDQNKRDIFVKVHEHNKYFVKEQELLSLDWVDIAQNKPIKIYAENQPIYYSLSFEYPLANSNDEKLAEDFSISRKYENISGTENIRAGDTIKVVLDIEIRGDERKYIVIEDPLPAGFVALNRDINGENRPNEDEEKFYYFQDFPSLWPDHMEYYPEKTVIYKNNAWGGSWRFTYYARAICPGDFLARPALIRNIYDFKQLATSAATKVTIEKKP